MTVRVGALTVDGAMVTASDVARASATESERARQAHRAARAIATGSVDAVECRLFLGMLGLDTTSVVRRGDVVSTPITVGTRKTPKRGVLAADMISTREAVRPGERQSGFAWHKGEDAE